MIRGKAHLTQLSMSHPPSLHFVLLTSLLPWAEHYVLSCLWAAKGSATSVQPAASQQITLPRHMGLPNSVQGNPVQGWMRSSSSRRVSAGEALVLIRAAHPAQRVNRLKALLHLSEVTLKLPYLVLFLQLGQPYTTPMLQARAALQDCTWQWKRAPGSKHVQNIHPSSSEQSQVLSSKPHWITLPTNLWALSVLRLGFKMTIVI